MINPEKTKLLIICATKRPHRIKEMLKSFDKTKSEGTEIIIYVSNQEPNLEEYEKALEGRNVIIDKSLDFNEVLNFVSCDLFPNIEYYGEINDDHIFRTKGWDKELIEVIEKRGNGWGIACGNDLVNKDWYISQHPSGSIISGNIVKTLGYYIYPKIKHFCGDDYLTHLGNGINRLFYMKDVIIEHMHYQVNKAKIDDVYAGVLARKDAGIKAFHEWMDFYKERDIRRLKDAILDDLRRKLKNGKA